MVWERGNGRTFKSSDLATIMNAPVKVKKNGSFNRISSEKNKNLRYKSNAFTLSD